MKTLIIFLFLLLGCSTQKEIPTLNFRQKEELRDIVPKLTMIEVERYVNYCKKNGLTANLYGFYVWMDKR